MMALSGTLTFYLAHDESGTGTRYDSTTNALDFTNNNSAPAATGKLNNGTDFTPASSQYLSRASESALQIGPNVSFLFSTWVKADSFGADRIIAKKGSEWMLYCDSGGTPRFYLDAFGKLVTWGSALSTGTWYCIAVWYDHVNDVAGITVDNATPVTSSHVWSSAADTDSFWLATNTSGSWWDGILDESLFGKFAPTAGDLTAIYGGGTPPGYSGLTSSTFTATAALTTAPATTSIAATSDPPTFSGTSAATTGAATTSAAAAATPPTFSATAGLSAAPATASAAATAGPPTFTATAAVSTGAATSSSAATVTPPTFTASAALSAAAAVLAASGTTTAGAVAPAGGLRAREGYALRAREGYALQAREGYALRVREG